VADFAAITSQSTMRIARVIGTLTMSRKLDSLKPGRYLVAETLDSRSLAGFAENAAREKPMPESLIVFDNLGAGVGQIIAVSEGAEATQPFRPSRVPLDAYASAILDTIEFTPQPT